MLKKKYKAILPLRGVRGEHQIIANLQELYNEYSFIDSSGTAEAKTIAGEAEDEASIKWHHLSDSLGQKMGAIIKRSYERPIYWYLVVFKPYNKAYEKDIDWFKVKGIDKCRKLFKRPSCYLLTREILSQKVHVNAIVATSQDLIVQHDQSYCNKYKLHVQMLHNLSDRLFALTYVTKEREQRSFVNYLDYIIYNK